MAPLPPRPTCPRCRGRLHRTQDCFGQYFSCLLCGYVHEIHDAGLLVDAKTPADTTRRPAAPDPAAA
jgi:hypothetical protein